MNPPSPALTNLVLPPRPRIVEDLIAERRRDEPDFRRVEALIERDVALAGAIIKTANSPVFRPARPISGVGQAMQMLGLSSVVNIACGLALRHMMKGDSGISLERFWDTAESVAIQCAALAQRFKSVPRDDAYSMGLFHDVGIPILLQRFPDYKDVLRAANARVGKQFVDVEDELIGTNHAVVGGIVARNWGLPDELVTAIRQHHDLGFFTGPVSATLPRVRNMVALVHLAEHLHHARVRATEDVEWESFGDAVLRHLEVEETEYRDLLCETAEP